MISKVASPFAILALTLVSTQHCEAFLPQRLAFRSAVAVTVDPAPTTTHPRPSWMSTSARSMGIVEDFVVGSDAKTRKVATEKYLLELQKRVDRINALESDIEDLGDEDLQAKTLEFRERLAKGEDINGPILEEGFAVVREAAW